MNIGEKIKHLRMTKMMTQSELVGDTITRNMLSQIENGVALPSLSTLIYIAGKLNVPVGYLVADDDNDFIYRKIKSMNNIRCAYLAKDYKLCRSICMTELGDADDEIYLILSECSFNVGREEMDNGHLHSAREYFDEALSFASKTAYNTTALKSQILTCFRYLTDMISGTLYSKQDVFSDNSLDMLAVEDPFCRYVLAIEALEKGKLAISEELYRCFDDSQMCYKTHLAARMCMAHENYSGAAEYLNTILKSDIAVSRHTLYLVMCDLEICSREINDYKSAYEFSSSKIDLLQKMLSEVVEL